MYSPVLHIHTSHWIFFMLYFNIWCYILIFNIDRPRTYTILHTLSTIPVFIEKFINNLKPTILLSPNQPGLRQNNSTCILNYLWQYSHIIHFLPNQVRSKCRSLLICFTRNGTFCYRFCLYGMSLCTVGLLHKEWPDDWAAWGGVAPWWVLPKYQHGKHQWESQSQPSPPYRLVGPPT